MQLGGGAYLVRGVAAKFTDSRRTGSELTVQDMGMPAGEIFFENYGTFVMTLSDTGDTVAVDVWHSAPKLDT
jgi:inorganic pyrophosphatase